MNDERWKPHPKLSNYLISSEGNIARIMNQNYSKDALCHTVNGKHYTTAMMVWLAFRGPITPGYMVIHKNDNLFDCRLDNLELVQRAGRRRISRKAEPKYIREEEIKYGKALWQAYRELGFTDIQPFLLKAHELSHNYELEDWELTARTFWRQLKEK